MTLFDIPKLNETFGFKVDVCRYCGGKCNLTMRQRDSGDTYPYSECPSCKQTIKHYCGTFLITSERSLIKNLPVKEGLGDSRQD